MKLFGIFLTACVVLAAAQAVAAVLTIALICGLIYGLFIAPRETFGLLGLLFIGGLFQAQPLAFLCVTGLLIAGRFALRACRATAAVDDSIDTSI